MFFLLTLYLLFLISPRHNQDCSTGYEQRKQGTVSSGHPGQRHGRPDGRTIRDHHCEHHTDWCQWQPTSIPSEYGASKSSVALQRNSLQSAVSPLPSGISLFPLSLFLFSSFSLSLSLFIYLFTFVQILAHCCVCLCCSTGKANRNLCLHFFLMLKYFLQRKIFFPFLLCSQVH